MAIVGGNPLLVSSDLPYGLPPFDHILGEHYLPALRAGMAQQRAEVDAIVANAEAPSFENTLVALERSGRLLDRVSAVFSNAAAADTNAEIQAIEAQVAPLLAAHSDAVWLDAGLYARVRELYERHDQLCLDPEAVRLLQRCYMRFVRSGAQLSAAEQERLRELNQRLAALSAEFGKRLLADGNDLAVWARDRAELAGLSEDAITAAADAARARGHEHAYLIQLVLSTPQPPLALLENRQLRVDHDARGGVDPRRARSPPASLDRDPRRWATRRGGQVFTVKPGVAELAVLIAPHQARLGMDQRRSRLPDRFRRVSRASARPRPGRPGLAGFSYAQPSPPRVALSQPHPRPPGSRSDASSDAPR